MERGTNLTVKLIRAMFVVACLIMGTIWARYVLESVSQQMAGPVNRVPWIALGGVIGVAVSIIVLVSLLFISQDLYERLSPALVAVVMAMVVGYFLGQYILWWWPDADVTLRVYVIATLVLVFGFIGISLGLTRASNWESLLSAVSKHNLGAGVKVLDTSVIIDGRIADIWESGFMEGPLIIPRFVLGELQRIADSSEVLRRAKGRRGLDILKNMQEGAGGVNILIVEDDPAQAREVDAKLVCLAKAYDAKIVTNDYNLNKVAQIEGVQVLNVNDLANALKPAVLPDERMQVKIVKEGKEPYQGVGYLDDGTMIVVDGGKNYVGKHVEAVVTSVLQTSAGRMIFTKLGRIL